MNTVLTIAGKELKDGMRNRWIIAISTIFAVMSVAIGYFGSASTGSVGFTSLPATIMSLASLVVFLIPLIALLLSYDAIVGEDESGTLLLLLSYPLSKSQLIIGKFVGHGVILSLSIIFGFGVAAVAIAFGTDDLPLSAIAQAFGLFILSSVLLGLVFVAIAYLISALVSEKSKAAGLALIVWFVFVLLYDMGLLGLLVTSEGKVSSDWFPFLLFFNPTDVFRLLNMLGQEVVTQNLGVLSLGVEFGFSSLITAMAAWVVAPLLVAIVLFRKRAL